MTMPIIMYKQCNESMAMKNCMLYFKCLEYKIVFSLVSKALFSRLKARIETKFKSFPLSIIIMSIC